MSEQDLAEIQVIQRQSSLFIADRLGLPAAMIARASLEGGLLQPLLRLDLVVAPEMFQDLVRFWAEPAYRSEAIRQIEARGGEQR